MIRNTSFSATTAGLPLVQFEHRPWWRPFYRLHVARAVSSGWAIVNGRRVSSRTSAAIDAALRETVLRKGRP